MNSEIVETNVNIQMVESIFQLIRDFWHDEPELYTFELYTFEDGELIQW